MNDDQQPNQDDQHEMTNPWPEQSQDESDEDTPSNEGSDTSSEQPLESMTDAEAAPAEVVEATAVPAQPEMVAPTEPIAPQPPVLVQPQAPVAGVAPQNPGQGFGIASIVLGVLAIWFVGLPLAIVSMVKSSKVNASKTLGIVGLVLNVLGIFVSGFILMIVLISFQAIQQKAHEVEAASNTAASSSANTITLSQDYAPTSTDVYFAVPASYTGWTMTTIDKDGVNKFTKDDNTATFMTYQGVLSGLTGTDKTVTEKAMGDYLTQLKATEVTGTQSTVSFECMSDKKLLEFETKQVTSISGTTALKGIVAVRMYEGHELSVIYLATADVFSMSEWTSLTSKVQINDGVY